MSALFVWAVEVEVEVEVDVEAPLAWILTKPASSATLEALIASCQTGPS